MPLTKTAALIAALLPAAAAGGDVVINEIFYNAPGDDLDDLQWIELYNTAEKAVDLSGWSFDKALSHTCPKGTVIAARGYLVLARSPEKFRGAYGVDAALPFANPLTKVGGRIRLLDASQGEVDAVRYKDSRPWPVSADGYSASLERISPSAPGDVPENWGASPLAVDARKPAGTPGQENTSFSAVLPPVIRKASRVPDDPAPGEPIRVEADVLESAALREVSLLYRVVAGGVAGEESTLPMLKDAGSGRFTASMPAQPAGTLVRYRVRAVNEAGARRLYPAENDLRPTLSAYVHDKWEPAEVSFGFIIHMGGKQPDAVNADAERRGRPRGRRFPFFGRGTTASEELPPRGTSAFVYVDHQSGKTALFDYVHITQRDGERGYKVHFHKDKTLKRMTIASIVFEGSERFLLAEALAYDVYRRAGNAACRAEFLRLWVDGRMQGCHLMLEQPNRAFLRRNKLRDDGNLYKIRWFGSGVVGQHEKRTNTEAGHEDLLGLIKRLEESKGDEQWAVIQESFNVEQVATYFAVNTVLSHWDGFFNNYFTYHDANGTGKWELYPWDQDKTWGYYDGVPDGDVFADMPLTFGMEGDVPPGGRDRRAGGGRGPGGPFAGGLFGGGPFGGGPSWWRPGGYFSKPLLANPQFRKRYLARTREILETVYTPEIYAPLIEALGSRLEADLKRHAQADGDDVESRTRLLAQNLQSLRAHILKRREFLLAQKDLRSE